jgi:type IV pilus assembly protein PilC
LPARLTIFRSFLGYTIPLRPLVLFFDGLAVQLNSGRSVSDAMVSSSTYVGDRELADICLITGPKVSKGAALCSSLQPYSGRFPELAMCLLEVGELSGGVADSARRIADTFNKILKVERNMRFNVYDPKLVLLGYCLLQLIFLLPAAAVQAQAGESTLKVMFNVVSEIGIQALELTILFMTLRSVMRQVYRWLPIRLIVDRLKLSIPQLGDISRKLSAARWARSFAVLMGAGVNISSALEVSARATLNAHYEHALLSAANQTRSGRSLSDCLSATKMLPNNLLSIVRTCEETGRFDDQLKDVAERMEEEAVSQGNIAMQKIIVALIVIFYLIMFSHMAV